MANEKLVKVTIEMEGRKEVVECSSLMGVFGLDELGEKTQVTMVGAFSPISIPVQLGNATEAAVKNLAELGLSKAVILELMGEVFAEGVVEGLKKAEIKEAEAKDPMTVALELLKSMAAK